MPFNECYDFSQDSFKDLVDKYVDDISLTDEEIRHIEHSIRGQQSSNLWWEYRKEKPAASNFYVAAVNKVDLLKTVFVLFFC